MFPYLLMCLYRLHSPDCNFIICLCCERCHMQEPLLLTCVKNWMMLCERPRLQPILSLTDKCLKFKHENLPKCARSSEQAVLGPERVGKLVSWSPLATLLGSVCSSRQACRRRQSLRYSSRCPRASYSHRQLQTTKSSCLSPLRLVFEVGGGNRDARIQNIRR